jgi:oxaloacetate decarboxylase gamma subunit
MTIVEMLGQSGVLTLLGMGIVFSFLVLLIISVSAASKVIHALGADKDAGGSPAAGTDGSGAGKAAAGKVAAITAAVREHQKSNSES